MEFPSSGDAAFRAGHTGIEQGLPKGKLCIFVLILIVKAPIEGTPKHGIGRGLAIALPSDHPLISPVQAYPAIWPLAQGSECQRKFSHKGFLETRHASWLNMFKR